VYLDDTRVTIVTRAYAECSKALTESSPQEFKNSIKTFVLQLATKSALIALTRKVTPRFVYI
jgi:hypothetical protein